MKRNQRNNVVGDYSIQICKINASNVTKKEGEELGIFCYKVPELYIKCNLCVKRGVKQNHIKCSRKKKNKIREKNCNENSFTHNIY